MGRCCQHAKLDADLVVALAGAAVGYGGRVLLQGDLRQVSCDEGAAERRGQRVLGLVEGAGLEGGPDVALHKLRPNVLDDGLHRARGHGLLSHLVELSALAQV